MNEMVMIAILIFFMVTLLFLTAFLFYRQRQGKKQIIDKINKFAAHSLSETAQNGNNNNGFLGKVRRSFLDLSAKLAPYSQPKNEMEVSHRRKKLIMAGYNTPHALVGFYGLKIILAVALPVCFYLGILFSNVVVGNLMLTSLLIGIGLAGFYLPEWGVALAIAQRQKEIREGFPDALDLMVVCVEAGMGLDQAIKKIADEMQMTHKAISEEFEKMSLEIRAGRSRRDAMRNLAERTGVEDVKVLVTLLIQTDKFGTSIAQALRVLSGSMRTKRRQRLEELAMKLPVKLMFPLILFIFPALFVVIIGPGVIRVFRSIIQTGFGS